jgi:hypothetical protein
MTEQRGLKPWQLTGDRVLVVCPYCKGRGVRWFGACLCRGKGYMSAPRVRIRKPAHYDAIGPDAVACAKRLQAAHADGAVKEVADD